MSAVEPFFTFHAHIPPHQLRELTLDQVAEHLDYYEKHMKG